MSKCRKVLVVDDQEPNRELLTNFLEALGYDSLEAENGAVGLDIMKSESVDIVLLDIMMPVMNGYATLAAMKADPSLSRLPVIVISAVDEMDTLTACLESGADDYHTKPFNPKVLKARIEGCLARKLLDDQELEHRNAIEKYNQELEIRVTEKVSQISAADKAMIFALSNLAESRDPETGEHLQRMREYTKRLAEKLKELSKYRDIITSTFVENIYITAPLHDIGKVGIPDRVLLKPGKLTDDEFKLMKMHSVIGADTLRNVQSEYEGNEFVQMGICVAESHHEKWNGSGYPHGISKEDIPLPARIIAIADVYDALTSKRCYKDAFSHEKSRSIIQEDSGEHFDPNLVEVFIEIEAEFPKIRADFQDTEKKLLK